MRGTAWLLAAIMAAAPAAGFAAEAFDPFTDVEAEAAKARELPLEELERTALAIVDDMEKTTLRFREVETKIREIPFDQKDGEEASNLKAEAAELNARLIQLDRHYTNYRSFYLRQGGEYEKIKLRRIW